MYFKIVNDLNNYSVYLKEFFWIPLLEIKHKIMIFIKYLVIDISRTS